MAGLGEVKTGRIGGKLRFLSNMKGLGKKSLTFFENVKVKESQKSRFAEIKVVGRDGNMYAFTGANSRDPIRGPLRSGSKPI